MGKFYPTVDGWDTINVYKMKLRDDNGLRSQWHAALLITLIGIITFNPPTDQWLGVFMHNTISVVCGWEFMQFIAYDCAKKLSPRIENFNWLTDKK